MSSLTRLALLSSAAIDRIQSSEQQGSTYGKQSFFFCSLTDQQSQDLQNILGSIFVQLCEAHPKLWKDVSERYRKETGQSSQEPRKLNPNELVDLIVQCAEHLEGAIIILDALNETRQSLSLLQLLLQMTERTKHVKVMISSTEELGLEGLTRPVTVVSVREEQTAGDIVDYIDKWLQEDEVFRHLPRALKKDIKLVLCDRANGTYDSRSC